VVGIVVVVIVVLGIVVVVIVVVGTVVVVVVLFPEIDEYCKDILNWLNCISH